jgi:LPPG:FO 2-phospho-L-lactate transferase
LTGTIASIRGVYGVPRRFVVLCGGLGGSRFVDALARAAGPESVVAVGNVGDDVEFLGLHVSPDLDTVLYTLAGLLDEERGWGVREETYNALAMAAQLGAEQWFTLGDRDIGLHLVRGELLRAGRPLSAVTEALARALGVAVRILPATDDPLRTKVATERGELDFQEWFVRRGHRDRVTGVRYDGAEGARPAPGVVEAIAAAELVFLAPSNPFVSIQPILAVPGIRGALAAKRVVALSPLVAGKALRGPLADMMSSLGHEPSAAGIRALYGDLVSAFVVDPVDAGTAGAIVSPIVMVEPEMRADVGRAVLEAVL